MLSREFELRLRASKAAYKLGHAVGMDGPMVSRLLTLNEMLRRRDAKLAKIGKALGLKPQEVFEGQ